MCRDFGHSWKPYTAVYIPQRKHYLETLLCVRCKSARRRLLDRTGSQLGSAYTYNEGYQVKGLGRLSGHDKDAVRLASLNVILKSMGD